MGAAPPAHIAKSRGPAYIGGNLKAWRRAPTESGTTMQLTGIHHLTAISAKAKGNVEFYTKVLGMRLVKKTANQDDVSAYHLFYADGLASPGSDLTFFDWPASPERRGTNAITRTSLRISGEGTFDYWT